MRILKNPESAGHAVCQNVSPYIQIIQGISPVQILLYALLIESYSPLLLEENFSFDVKSCSCCVVIWRTDWESETRLPPLQPRLSRRRNLKSQVCSLYSINQHFFLCYFICPLRIASTAERHHSELAFCINFVLTNLTYRRSNDIFSFFKNAVCCSQCWFRHRKITFRHLLESDSKKTPLRLFCCVAPPRYVCSSKPRDTINPLEPLSSKLACNLFRLLIDRVVLVAR